MKKAVFTVLQILGYLLLVVGFLFCMFAFEGLTKEPLIGVAIGYVLAFVGLYLVMFLHELGHTFFGWLTGYDMVGLGMGKHLFYRRDGKWSYKKAALPMGAGAQYIGVKRDEKDQRFFLMWSGGLIVHLMLMLAGLILGLVSQNWWLALSWIAVNLGFFLNNALPIGITDGAKILELGQHPSHIPYSYLALRHAAQTILDSDGSDLKDYLREPEPGHTGTILDHFSVSLAEVDIMAGRLDQAEERLNQLLQDTDNDYSQAMAQVILLQVYLLKGELEQAEKLAKKPMVKRFLAMKMGNVQTINALYQLRVEKNLKKTEQAIKVAKKAMPASRMMRDEQAYYKDLLEQVEEELQNS